MIQKEFTMINQKLLKTLMINLKNILIIQNSMIYFQNSCKITVNLNMVIIISMNIIFIVMMCKNTFILNCIKMNVNKKMKI